MCETYQTKQISHTHLWVLILVDIQDGLQISIDRSTIASSMCLFYDATESYLDTLIPKSIMSDLAPTLYKWTDLQIWFMLSYR